MVTLPSVLFLASPVTEISVLKSTVHSSHRVFLPLKCNWSLNSDGSQFFFSLPKRIIIYAQFSWSLRLSGQLGKVLLSDIFILPSKGTEQWFVPLLGSQKKKKGEKVVFPVAFVTE